MAEWLREQYINLMVNFQILSGDSAVHCYAVDQLRVFTAILSMILLVKVSIHLAISYRLKSKFSLYAEATHPDLISLYRTVAEKTNVWRLPSLYKFANERPVVFTIGFISPTIFLAPALVEKLPREELEAVLVHELTHVKRWDNLLIWLLEIFFVAIPVLVVQFFAAGFVFSGNNSELAIWGALATIVSFRLFLWHRILHLRELSCDDLSVDTIRDPLVLASSLISVWRIAKVFPKRRWETGLAFVQTFLPTTTFFEVRVKRLVDYQRPRFKFVLGKAYRAAAILLVTLMVTFLWQYYSTYRYVHFHIDSQQGIYVCSGCNMAGT